MKVMILVPSHRQPHPAMMESIHRVVHKSRVNVGVEWLFNESMICRARAMLLSKFMQSKAQFAYFWDDDISAPDDVIDVLLDAKKDFVGGLYPTRSRSGHCAGRLQEHPDSDLFEVVYLAGGSMLISRDAVEVMIRANQRLEFEVNTGREIIVGHALFRPMIYKGEYLSEDFAFCQRWKDLGGTIWADRRILLEHWGEAPFTLQL